MEESHHPQMISPLGFLRQQTHFPPTQTFPELPSSNEKPIIF